MKLTGSAPLHEQSIMIDEKITRQFGAIWSRHVDSLSQFLIDCRQHFDGDLDLFLILCIIGERTFPVRTASPDMDFDSWNKTRSDSFQSIEINLQSLADYSGIPRETVRRKVSVLLRKGWVVREGTGAIRATDRAKDDLAPLTRSALIYLSRMKAVLSDNS